MRSNSDNGLDLGSRDAAMFVFMAVAIWLWAVLQ
jgi:hypothetical protein